MNNQIVISADVVDEDTLGELLANMKTALDASGYLEKCFFVTSDDSRVLSALRSMFESTEATPEPKAKKSRKKVRAATKTRRPHARWTIVGGDAPVESIGTTLSPFELSKALSEHRLAIGAELEHPKQGRKVVQVNGSADSPYKLVDAGELPDN